MPKANWGVDASDIDDFDRSQQFKPYDGPKPPFGVYKFQIKKLQYFPATKSKAPSLRIGLELVPRSREDKRYAGYFIMLFRAITDRNRFTWVPFLDAIGVNGREFKQGTITDEAGNIKKIGRWRNTGEEMILAELKQGDNDLEGNPRNDCGWMGPVTEEDAEDFDDDEEGYDDEGDDDDDDDDDDWE